jgi:ferrochelatase
VYEAEPAYIDQLRETADAIAARAGLDEWTWAYQSAGHTKEEWLRPDLTDVFPEIARSGHRAVVVAPVQFLADHLEVLYDLDVAAADQAAAAGLRYSRVAMPNTRPSFIAALADVARRASLEPVA